MDATDTLLAAVGAENKALVRVLVKHVGLHSAHPRGGQGGKWN